MCLPGPLICDRPANGSKGYLNRLDTFVQEKSDVPGNFQQKSSHLSNMMPRIVPFKCCKMDLLKQSSAMSMFSNSSWETNKTHCQAAKSSPRTGCGCTTTAQRSASQTLITLRVRAFKGTAPKGSSAERAKEPVQTKTTPAITRFISRLKS